MLLCFFEVCCLTLLSGVSHLLAEAADVVHQRGQRNVELGSDHPDRTDDAAAERLLNEAKDVLNTTTYRRDLLVALLLFGRQWSSLLAFLAD